MESAPTVREWGRKTSQPVAMPTSAADRRLANDGIRPRPITCLCVFGERIDPRSLDAMKFEVGDGDFDSFLI
jgi:hypothetical protein